MRNKLMVQWGILLFGLILLGGAVAHSQYNSYMDTRTIEEQRLLTQVRVINTNLSSRLESTDKVLGVIRAELKSLAPKDWAKAVPSSRFDLLVTAIAGVRSIIAIDAQGVVRISNWREMLGKDLSQRDYFQLALKESSSKQLFLSPPFKTLLGAWGINLVRVIQDDAGNFAGIVLATLDPVYFKTLLGSINYAPDMWSALAHGDGAQFIMEPERAEQSGTNLAKPGSFFSRHASSGKVENILTGTVFSTGEKRMMALYSIKPASLDLNKPLVVAASRDLHAVYKKWRDHAWNQAVTFAVICLVSVVSLIAFQRYQRKQLHLAAAANQALMDARQQLSSIIDFLPDATFVIDNEKKVVVWNRAMEKMSGVPKDAMIGKGVHEYAIPFYGERRKLLLELFDVEDTELSADYNFIRRNGEVLDAETFCPALNGGKGAHVLATGVPLYNILGERIGAIESIRDISERMLAEEYQRKLTHGIENSSSAVMITDLQGTIEYVNKKFTQLTGYSLDEVIGMNPRILKSETTPRDVFDDLWSTILSGKEWRGELQNRRKNGEIYWSIASISPLHNKNGELTHFIANVEDINERKNAEATIQHLAYFDPLTELPNRRMLQDRIELAIKRSKRQASSIALLYIDLDRFKNVNDTFGHPFGDKLLKEMGARFSYLLRDDDIICRLGGDEFAVLLQDIQHNDGVAQVAAKLLDAAAQPFVLEDSEVAVTTSIGIALFPADANTVDALVKHADIALYQAKAQGKNTFSFFAEDLNEAALQRMHLENALRLALGRNEFRLCYQPKVDLAAGMVVGVEALLRWDSPEFGLVSPVRFIPIAEETNLIVDIGKWVMQTACLQQVAWKQEGINLKMAINISSLQFRTEDLIQKIATLIDETGVSPDQVEIELTESALADSPDVAELIMNQIRSLGFGIAIDDFGTGYSSLSYLRHFPVTVLKIDRSFVMDIVRDSGARAVAQTVIDLAKNLSMTTVAEGVETKEQLDILEAMGCNLIQGYYFSKPVPPEQIPDVMQQLQKKTKLVVPFAST